MKGQKYCQMLPLEHFAILLTCFNQMIDLKTNYGLLFEWSLKTDFTVYTKTLPTQIKIAFF